MKADLSRYTFNTTKHYRSVLMQQGRVQTDADWNEQQDIVKHRVETETLDSVGRSAGPHGYAGFGLSPVANQVTIGEGRYYLDGLLCENAVAVSAVGQPDLPAAASPILPDGAGMLPLPPLGAAPLASLKVYDNAGNPADPPDGIYFAYLEAWVRHITALEDEAIREVALGGPDTGTREQTIWQVKFLRAGDLGSNVTCQSIVTAWEELVNPPDGTLAARAEPSTPPKDPCLLAPDAGFRRLENQLYRVEIHDDGTLSGKVRYKWSRDNGSIASKVTRWLGSPLNDEFEVSSTGRDAYLAIVPGCWVEFYDDTHELLGHPGTLVQVLKTAGNVVTVDLGTKTGPLDEDLFNANPRVRRWDGWSNAQPASPNSGAGWAPLEDGVEIKFALGRYRIGDYWMIPARTATADVEWPRASGKPAFQPPLGTLRAFARLAVLSCSGGNWSLLSDCRNLFPALTELTSLFYVGGDGQEAVPNPLQPTPVPLPQSLKVAVYNGQFPVTGAEVRFTVHDGQLDNGSTAAVIVTDADGIAAANWHVDAHKVSQTAIAELLECGQPAPGKYNEIHFSAQLSIAEQVAYDAASCAELKAQGIRTVQGAIDALCMRSHDGGCCTTVGKGGQFPTLDKAVHVLMEQGATDICLCLLPGDQRLEGDLSVLAPPHGNLTIHGAGRASRLQLRGQGFKLVDFASVELSGFDVQGIAQELCMFFRGCADVRLSNLHVAGTTTAGASLVSVNNALRIDIEETSLHGYQGATVRAIARVIAHVEAMLPFAESLGVEEGESFRLLDGKLATQLAALNTTQRKVTVRQITTLLRETDEPLVQDPEIQHALLRLSDHVQKSSDSGLLAIVLAALRTAILIPRPGFALALDAPDAITTVTNNVILGRLSLYGESSIQAGLPQTVLKPLGAGLASGRIRLVPGRGYLRLMNNHLTEVRLSDGLLPMLKEVADAQQGTVENCYRSLLANDNEWYGSNSQMLAFDLGLSLNALHASGDFGASIATQTKCLGNFAHNDFRLFNAGNTAEAFGNGGLNIVNFV